MAGDPLKKVQAGERLNIPAEAYNAFIDAARATRGQQALGANADAFSRQTTLAKVRNLTGANRERFSIVGLSQPIVPPADNEAEFLRQTTFDGVMPASGYEHRFGVLLEPLGVNKIGLAAVAGVVPVKVHFTADDHKYAVIKNGDATRLKSAASGEALILWHEDFPESTEPPNITLWALVFLGAQRQPRIVAGTTNAVVLNTASEFQIENLAAIVGTAPSAPLTIQNWFGVGYALGEYVVAIELANGQWVNEPYYGRVYATAGDTFPESLYYKLWGHGAFNPTYHQPVYFEVFAADLVTHGPPVPRALVRAFTDKGAGGGGSYSAGCGINSAQLAADIIEVLVDPYGCILCDPTAGLKIKLDPDGCLDCGNEAGLKVKLSPDGCLTCDTSVEGGLKVKIDPNGCLACDEEDGLKVKVDPDGCLECGEDGLKIEIDPDGCIGCPSEGDGLKVIVDPNGCLECGEDGLRATYLPGPGVVIAGCVVSVNYGCGLTTTFGVLHVNNIDLAGNGLVPEGTCGLAVNVGCGLEIVADAVRVKNSDLAGNGLGVEGTCGLKVNVGCGLEIVSDVVQVKTSDLVGNGLETVGGSGQCAMQVKVGCGLELASGAVRVKNSELAGAGLGTEGICALKVNVGCGLEIVSDAVQVKLKPSGGLICTAEGLATNIGVGCGLDFLGDTIFFDAPTVAGSGLVVEGPCSLAVNVGCGLEVVSDQVRVRNADLAGAGLAPDGICGLKVNTGCGLEIAGDAVQVKVDPAGCIECHGTSGLKLKGDPVTIRSIKQCELMIEGGELKLKLTYDVFSICAEAGSVNQIEECSVEVIDCEEAA
ncbi:MAG: hypothetical protein L0228_10835 [Planctomycetes bacterium]|nr:hypothetical protein [Planctomycetota bacterium]